jgi:predicted PurR-regulated permease PerM
MRSTRHQTGFLVLLVAFATLAFFGVIRAFIMPLFWATVLAIVFQPVQGWWLRVVRGRASLASILTILTILLVVILPLGLLFVALSREALLFYNRIQTGEIDLAGAVAWVEGLVPVGVAWLEVLGLEFERLREGVANLGVGTSLWIAEQALAIGQDALRISILSLLMLYVLFFFLRDGERILGAIGRVLPLNAEREQALVSRFVSVSRATVGGALAVAAAQGAAGGLVFWILGIPGPVFWGAIMTILSFLPAVGASLVWGPAAVILLLTGSPVRGIILVALGMVFVGTLDNILRPLLVGRYARMPDFLILISTLGGLATFGLSGVVIGPIVAAFFISLWEMFGKEYEEGTPV